MKLIIIKSIALAFIVSVVGTGSAQAAYIDPSTGGQLFQLLVVIIGFMSAILLFLSSYIKMFVARGKRFVRGLIKRGGSNEIA